MHIINSPKIGNFLKTKFCNSFKNLFTILMIIQPLRGCVNLLFVLSTIIYPLRGLS